METQCPNCQAMQTIDDPKTVGTMIVCNKCGDKFYVLARRGHGLDRTPTLEPGQSGGVDDTPIALADETPRASSGPSDRATGMRSRSTVDRRILDSDRSKRTRVWPVIILSVVAVLALVYAFVPSGGRQQAANVEDRRIAKPHGAGKSQVDGEDASAVPQSDRSRTIDVPDADPPKSRAAPNARDQFEPAQVRKNQGAVKARENAIVVAGNSVGLVEHPLGSGAGFMVAANIVATSARLLAGAFADEIRVVFGKIADKESRVTQVLHFDPRRDLCLLEIDAKWPVFLELDAQEIRDGTQVNVYGAATGAVGTERPKTVTGIVMSSVRVGEHTYYKVENLAFGGMQIAGGPVVLSDGRVGAMVAAPTSAYVPDVFSEYYRKLQKPIGRAAAQGAPNAFSGFGQKKAESNVGPHSWLLDPDAARPIRGALATPAKSLDDALAALANRKEGDAARHAETLLVHALARRAVLVAGIDFFLSCASESKRLRNDIAKEKTDVADDTAKANKLKKKDPKDAALRKVQQRIDTLVELIPEQDASVVRARLEKLRFKLGERLEDRFEQVAKATTLDPKIKQAFAELAPLASRAAKFAETPPERYLIFSQELRKLDDELHKSVRKLMREMDAIDQ